MSTPVNDDDVIRTGNGDWMSTALAGMLGLPNDYDSRVIDRTTVCGLVISTCWTDDFGYETAIIDATGIYPVERYKTKRQARLGHAVWCDKAPTLTLITELGTPDGLVEPQEVSLVRSEDVA